MPPAHFWIMLVVYFAGFGAVLGWFSARPEEAPDNAVLIAWAWPLLALVFAVTAALLVLLSPFIGLGWLAFVAARAIRGGPERGQERKGFPRRGW